MFTLMNNAVGNESEKLDKVNKIKFLGLIIEMKF